VHVAGFVALLRPCRNEDVGVLRPGKHLRSVPVPAAGSSAPRRAVKTVKRNFVSAIMYSAYRHAPTLLDFRTDFGVSGSVFEPRRSLLCLSSTVAERSFSVAQHVETTGYFLRVKHARLAAWFARMRILRAGLPCPVRGVASCPVRGVAS